MWIFAFNKFVEYYLPLGWCLRGIMTLLIYFYLGKEGGVHVSKRGVHLSKGGVHLSLPKKNKKKKKKKFGK